MAAANPLWRAPPIHGELKMLGIAICECTVSRMLRSQTWKTFLHNHLGQMVSIDFFTVPTIIGAHRASESVAESVRRTHDRLDTERLLEHFVIFNARHPSERSHRISFTTTDPRPI